MARQHGYGAWVPVDIKSNTPIFSADYWINDYWINGHKLNEHTKYSD